jgi:hypothetical protein
MDNKEMDLSVGWWNKPSPFTPNGAWQAEDEDFPASFVQPGVEETLRGLNNLFRVQCTEKDCTANILVQDATFKTTYTCREHTAKAPDEVRLQQHQFSREFESGGATETE